MSDETFLQDPRLGRRQYLVTYSQADEKKFPTRQSFGNMIQQEFNGSDGKCTKVLHWACCKEEHEHHGFHYHCAVKLSHTKKWLSVKRNIQSKHGIVINFSDKHDYYLSAYRYVCKEDPNVEHSAGHPNLREAPSPKTKTAISAYRKRKSTESSSHTASSSKGATVEKKPARLTNLQVGDMIVQNKIRSKTELYAMAESRKREGENDLANFLFSRQEKTISEVITKSWFLKSAGAELVRENTSRMELVCDAAENQQCEENCEWLTCALEVLSLNRIPAVQFATNLRTALREGRGKFKNVMLVGRTNCAKTFILKPLKEIFKNKVFENPTNDKFGWVGADKAEVILLNDFRYSKELITWKDLLLLLEGDTVKLPAPKNHYIADVIIDTDVPIFATSKSKITYRGPFNSTDDRESEMMDSRWKIVEFKHEFKEEEQKVIKPCGHCFAKLVLMGDE